MTLQFELSLKCWQCFYCLDWNFNSTDLCKCHIFKKWHPETVISDFEEFVDYFLLVNSNAWDSIDIIDSRGNWKTAGFKQRWTKNEMVKKLVDYALEITFDKDWSTERYEKSYLQDKTNHKQWLAIHYIDDLLDDYYKHEHPFHARYDELAWEFHCYIKQYTNYENLEDVCAKMRHGK